MTTFEIRERRLAALAAEVGGSLGEEIAGAWRDYYTLFSASVIDWFAGLYDPKIGGYYYSNSARDNEGFLPDAESTCQALGFWESAGMCAHYRDGIPAWMREQIGNFICNLQDPDGYFYHPQWGKQITISRRARDFNWCRSMLGNFGIPLRYKTILDRPSGETDAQTLIPDHLTSREKFLAYLESKNLPERSYHTGNELTSQKAQIMACGLAQVCADFLSAHQHPDTGHWHSETNYYAVNGLMKISSFYSGVRLPMPHPMEAAISAMNAITSEEPMGAVVDLYNTWFAVGNILNNLRTCGGEEGAKTADEIVGMLRARAPEGIRRSREKIADFQKPDGSFSYGRLYSSPTSQGAPAAVKNSVEGDVNGTVIAIMGIIGQAFRATDLSPYKPPLFGEEERRHYIALLEEKR